METARLEEMVYSALKNNTELMELLANGESSIFHLKAPAVDPAFPYLVYTPISDVPNLFGDNKEFLHRVTIRIHIVTGDEDYFEPYSVVKNIMVDLGFTRLQATPFIDEHNIRMLIVDFKIITGG